MPRTTSRETWTLACFLYIALSLNFSIPDAIAATEEQVPKGIFATVQGEAISEAEFNTHLVQYARSKLYHAISEDDLRALWQEAADDLIQHRLLVLEADRRGITGDVQAVERDLEAYESRYKDTAHWAGVKERLPGIRRKLLENTKIDALKERLRHVEAPNEAQLKAFYDANLESFTEPARIDLSTILISVPPYETAAAWGAAQEKAEDLLRQMTAGAVFEELAKVHSNHESAASGGRVGLIHAGMLTDVAQEAVDALSLGEVTQPVRLLEGIALFRVNNRLPARLRPLADVRERAVALFMREAAEAKWTGFLSQLSKNAEIVLFATVPANPPQ